MWFNMTHGLTETHIWRVTAQENLIKIEISSVLPSSAAHNLVKQSVPGGR